MMNFEAFFKLTYGLYILSSKSGDRYNGHVSNTVFQVTAEPPRIMVATHRENLTTDFIRKSRVFSVSALQKDVTLEFLGPWGFKSGREIRKFDNIEYKIGKTGAPILTEKCIAWYDCEVEQEIEVGTHTLFIGKVVDLEILDENKEPLTYAWYRDVIKGVSPEHSPTYLSQDKLGVEPIREEAPVDTERPSGEMQKYRCTICGHIYDPVEGDPPAGIPPGTPFEDIPDDWSCPVCGVTKEDFIPMD